MKIVAAADGSCLGNPGPGGWAWITEDGRSGSAGARASTNNRMELRAVLELLINTDPGSELVIQSDSAYVIGVFTQWLKTWRMNGMRKSSGKRVENLDLVERIDSLLTGRVVNFEKVPGHAGHRLNEKADALAQAAARKAQERLARESARSPAT